MNILIPKSMSYSISISKLKYMLCDCMQFRFWSLVVLWQSHLDGNDSLLSLSHFFVSNDLCMFLLQIFELLLAFSSINELRPTICRNLMMTPYLEALDSSVEPARLASTEPYFAAINWAMQDVETYEKAPIMALEFLTDVYEVSLCSWKYQIP